MYLLCYGRSDRARKTGEYLMEVLKGRWIESADFFSSRDPLPAHEKDGIIVMLLPLEASIRILNDNFSPNLIPLPVLCVSPERKFASVLSRGDHTTLADTEAAFDAIAKLLGPDCFREFGGIADIAPDLTEAISSYDMKVNDEETLNKISEHIRAGGKVNLYSDLPITFAEPSLDSMVFDYSKYGMDTRESFCQAYISERKTGSGYPSIFVTCTKLPETSGVKDVLVLTPKLISVGLEFTGRVDSGYVTDFVWDSLEKHGLNPESVSTVAVSSLLRDNEAVHAIADKLGASVTAFSSKTLNEVKVPLRMTFAPQAVTGELCTAAACLASNGGKILIRRAGGNDGVLFTVALRKGTISLTE